MKITIPPLPKEQYFIKVKPFHTYDVALIAVQKGKGKHLGRMGALLTAWMDEEKRFRFAGKIGTGFLDEEREFFMDFAKKNKVETPKGVPVAFSRDIIWVEPKIVIEAAAQEVVVDFHPAFEYKKAKWSLLEDLLPSGILRMPVFKRIREDKEVKPSDLRLTQIPGWKAKVKFLEKEEKSAENLLGIVKFGISQPQFPNVEVIRSVFLTRPLCQKDLFEYYRREDIKERILEHTKGRPVVLRYLVSPRISFVLRRTRDNQTIYFEKSEDIDFWNNGMLIEIIPEVYDVDDLGRIDFDGNPFFHWYRFLKVVAFSKKKLLEDPQIEATLLKYSGNRGFHTFAYFSEPKVMDDIYNFLEQFCIREIYENENINWDKKVKFGSIGLDEVRMDLLSNNAGRGMKAPWSLDWNTGLISIPLPDEAVPIFRKELASPLLPFHIEILELRKDIEWKRS